MTEETAACEFGAKSTFRKDLNYGIYWAFDYLWMSSFRTMLVRSPSLAPTTKDPQDNPPDLAEHEGNGTA